MEALLKEQKSIYGYIERTIDNVEKIGKSKLSHAVIENRRRILEEYWQRVQNIHQKLLAMATDEQVKTLEYFTQECINAIEDSYLAASDYLAGLAHDIQVRSTNTEASHAENPTLRQSHPGPRLPKINLPTFNGNYVNWESFRDMFLSLVHNNASISGIEKFHYLKTSLTGEAASLVKSIQPTASNNSRAWERIRQRFDNPRLIRTAIARQLLLLESAKSDDFRELKRLRDRINECVDALESEDFVKEHLGKFLVIILSMKLDSSTLKAWDLELGNRRDLPKYEEFDTFLEGRINALESFTSSKVKSSSAVKDSAKPAHKFHVARTHVTTALNCTLCHSNHYLEQCNAFLGKTAEARRDFARASKLCFNCLKPGHLPRKCTWRKVCATCHQKHHALLHVTYSNVNVEQPHPNSLASGNFPAQIAPNAPEQTSTSGVHCASETHQTPKAILLATAWIKLSSPSGQSIIVRALIDPCSQSTFISETVAQSLCLPRIHTNVTFTGIDDIRSTNIRSRANVSIGSRAGVGPNVSVSAFIVKTVSHYTPPQGVETEFIRNFRMDVMADPEPTSQHPIHVLLGADVYAAILLEGIRRDTQTGLLAQNSTLGWLILGSAVAGDRAVSLTYVTHHIASVEELNRSIKRFWEIEELPDDPVLSVDDQRCEKLFHSSHTRRSDGTFQVRLPFKTPPPIPIGETDAIAKSMFCWLERRLEKDPVVKGLYHDFMRQYLELGHMEAAGDQPVLESQRVLLPHHPVIKPHSSTTKLRVVFNAACKSSNGTALNDHFLTGPKLQTDIVKIVNSWRQARFVMVADIEKMYRQIWVDQPDAEYQCILWRFNANEAIRTFRLLTVTYGTSCAPFLALRVIRQLAIDGEARYPLGAEVLRDGSYVDDVLFGGDSLEGVYSKRDQVCALLAEGGFHLRKWLANHDLLLHGIPPADREQRDEISIQDGDQAKVLGLVWDPRSDSFTSRVTVENRITFTKRAVLSVVAKYFDPLGWYGPVIIRAKVLIQDLWLAKLDWDEELPTPLRAHWQTYSQELPELNEIRIPRWTGHSPSSQRFEIHGFADASSRAYAACVYALVVDDTGNTHSSLMLAKTKVAPVKTVSIPRLELCAAVLLARTVLTLKQSLNIERVPTFCWSDSAVVLCWLRQHASRWKTFVANRVAQIQSLLPAVEWAHVPSAENPADCATRGLTPAELQHHSLWWGGPPWLREPRNSWPTRQNETPSNADLEAQGHGVVLMEVSGSGELEVVDRIAKWPKLTRIIAYCLRWLNKVRRNPPQVRLEITASEFQMAELTLIKSAQRSLFAEEIRSLSQNEVAKKSSRVYRTDPFLDLDGVLRVGGRLHRSALPYGGRHPLLLADHPVTRKIITHAHETTLHGGAQLMISTLRQRYWVLGVRNLVRHTIRRCTKCTRIRAELGVQYMGSLPGPRVNPSKPFTHTGVDYAGPLMVRAAKGRGRQSYKAYIALFICFPTRAIHLELVSDYSAETFMAALHRFVSRRGLPIHIYSDNGTTFVGANRDLQRAIQTSLNDPSLLSFSTVNGITWHFSPPHAPHFGGLWEAVVKSVKHHLRRVIGDSTLTFEEIYTLLTRVEACLNSRPLGPLTDDPTSLAILTPGHFLIGGPLNEIPEPSLLDLSENRLTRWQLVQQRLQRFWKLWATDYLHTLQQRYKWTISTPNLEINDLVLVKNPTAPPAKWLMGRVVECFPGADGRVRVVRVRTQTATYTRPITQLCLLPIRSHANSDSL